MSDSRVPPIITLTTDFGLADHYVGTMKGVLLSGCREAQLVDISHQIAPFSIISAAYAIDQAAPYFPPSTVHLIVVDPGVGTARKPLCVAALGQFFVAPDNGVLSFVTARDPHAQAYEVTNREFWLESASATFHGRDIFAPVAAALASGAARAQDLGPIVQQIEVLPGFEPQQVGRNAWSGAILSVDRFGNAITNLRSERFSQLASAAFVIDAGPHHVTAFCETFGAAPPGLAFAYFGSSGYVELGMNQQSAAATLGLAPGARITLRR